MLSMNDNSYNERHGVRQIAQLMRAREEARLQLAERLHLTPQSVSWVESLTDEVLDALRNNVETRGGRLELCVSFRDVVIPIEHLKDLDGRAEELEAWFRLEPSS